MKNRKIIAIDMDDTIADLYTPTLEDHNEKFPSHKLTFEQLEGYNDSIYHPDYDIEGFFKHSGVFSRLKLIDDYVLDEMKKINEEYDLIILTAALPESVLDKWNWLQEYMPFIKKENFITANRKDLINADLLIDDAKHNIEKWSQTGKPAIVIDYHWNQECKNLKNVYPKTGWNGMLDLIKTILS